MRILLALVFLGAGCAVSSNTIAAASGEAYEVDPDHGSSAGPGKSKVKGFGNECRDAEDCERWSLDCVHNRCTFSCASDAECQRVGTRCVPVTRVVATDQKVCAQR